MIYPYSASNTVPSTPNTVWGPIPPGYDVVRLVASGQQSEVWELCEKQGGKTVAWKRMPLGNGLSMQRGIGFATEAAVLHAVKSPYIVRLEQDLTDGNPRSFILEWLDGETLAARSTGEHTIPLGLAFWYGRQVAEGLRDLWHAGYAHGNIQPENVILCRTGAVKIIDFSSARFLDDLRSGTVPQEAGETVEFLTPERLAQSPASPMAADVYGLGILLFLLLAGRPPFTGDNAEDVRRLHRQAKPPSLQRIRPDLPVQGRLLIERMLSKQPLRRPHDPTALVHELMDLELQTVTQRVA